MAYPQQNRNDDGRVAESSVTQEIDIDTIGVPKKRLRALQPTKVAEIAASMKDLGQLQPIVVRPHESDHALRLYRLVFGLHRLEAAKKNGAKTILAVVKDMDAAAAEMAEIDENLARADLSPAERSLHLARRKELYEEQHKETKHGAIGRGRKKTSQDEKSFVADTAAKTGKGRSTIARDVTRANKVVVLAEIAGTSLDQGDELDALAKKSEAEQRSLAKRAAAGEKVTAKATKGSAAAKARKANPVAGNDIDPEASAAARKCEAEEAEGAEAEPTNNYGALLDAWRAATSDEQRRFLIFIGADFVAVAATAAAELPTKH